MSEQEHFFYGSLCEGQVDAWEMFSDNSYLSAILDRQGLQVTAPVDLRTKKAEIFTPQLLQGLLVQAEEKESQDRCDVSECCYEEPQATRSYFRNNTICAWPWQNTKSLSENTSLFWWTETGRIWWLKKVQHLPKKSTAANGPSCEAINPSGNLHNFGNLLRPLELVPASRERVVLTEWQVRTVLGDCMSRAKVIPTQAPQHRQHAHLSIREEAALATNWIRDRPGGLKLQNLALATTAGPVMSSSPKNLTADVQHAMNKCETLGSGKI